MASSRRDAKELEKHKPSRPTTNLARLRPTRLVNPIIISPSPTGRDLAFLQRTSRDLRQARGVETRQALSAGGSKVQAVPSGIGGGGSRVRKHIDKERRGGAWAPPAKGITGSRLALRKRRDCPITRLTSRLLDTFKKTEREFYDYKVVPGATLGERKQYRVLKEIGKGVYGKVIRALDTEQGVDVAIKVIRRQKLFVNQAKFELSILRTMHSDRVRVCGEPVSTNIVKLRGAFHHQGHPCLVFELLYRNLWQLLCQTHLRGVGLSLVRKIAAQTLRALAHLRRKGIIHCDVKPENLMLRQKHRSHLKLIDFGSALASGGGQRRSTYIQSRYYRAPEVVLGLPDYSCAIDMWSLGCVLVELYTGRPLFPGTSETDLMLYIVGALGPPPDWMLRAGKFAQKHFDPVGTRRVRRGEEAKRTGGATQSSATRWTLKRSLGTRHRVVSLQKCISKRHGREPDETALSQFRDLVSKMLIYDWNHRVHPEDALGHRFFLDADR